MDLIKFLKKDMKKRKLNINSLSAEIGISNVMLHYIIKGEHKAGVKSMRAIAEYYDLDIRKVVEMNDAYKRL